MRAPVIPVAQQPRRRRRINWWTVGPLLGTAAFWGVAIYIIVRVAGQGS